MKSQRWRIFIGVLSFLWLMLVITFYYVNHKPFVLSQALILTRVLCQILIAIFVLGVSGGLGSRLLPEMDIRPSVKLTLQVALGLGFLSIVVLVGGSLIGVNIYLSWILFISLALIFRRDFVIWWKTWDDILAIWRESGRLGKLIATSIGLIAVSTLFTALAPPLKYDALLYHLTIPQIYIETARVHYIHEITLWGYPQLGEILYTWLISLGGIETAPVMGWMAGVLTVVGLIGYTRQRIGISAAWVAAASILSGFTLASSLAWGYVEWLVILYGLCVFIVLDYWREKGGLIYLAIVGTYVGLALGVKYSAFVIFFAGLVVVIYPRVKNNLISRKTITNLVIYMVPAILLYLPWSIKNVLATGNPFYPFFIPAGEMDRFRIEYYQLPPWGYWWDLFLLPWMATIQGIEGTSGFNASIGPLLLVLGPLALLGWSSRTNEQRRNTILTATILGLAGISVWAIANRYSGFLIQSRLYFSIFPALAILAGAGFNSISKIYWFGIRLRRIVGSMVLLVIMFTTFEVVVSVFAMGTQEVLFGLRTAEDYINDNLGWYGPAMKAIRELPDDGSTLMLWEPRSLYCLPKCSPDEILDRWAHDRYKYRDLSAILESWKDEGYTHILIHQTGADFVRKEDTRYHSSDWEALEELLGGLLLLEDFGGAYYLYALEM